VIDEGCGIQDSGYRIIDTINQFMARIKVDLHDIYNNSKAIDKALLQAFEEAIDKKIKEVEIIPGKGSGQLRKKVERFLQLPHIKPLYHRIENDSKNFGRLFVYFKF
jgi:DNA-nicking Smr family endonuclease